MIPQGLLKALNGQVATYNADKPEADQIAPFDETAEAWTQLNKLAFWMRDRQRQNAADAREHPAVSVLPREARPAPRAEPYPPSHAE